MKQLNKIIIYLRKTQALEIEESQLRERLLQTLIDRTMTTCKQILPEGNKQVFSIILPSTH